MSNKDLVAVCGLFCGVCTFYRAWHDGNKERIDNLYQRLSAKRQLSRDDMHCDGCLAGGELLPYCRECKFKECAKSRGVMLCSDCGEFPCSNITSFNNDGMRHHALVLDNLRRIRQIGIDAWLKEYEEHWRCPQCQAPSDWYAQSCFHCGAPQPERLPQIAGGRSI